VKGRGRILFITSKSQSASFKMVAPTVKKKEETRALNAQR